MATDVADGPPRWLRPTFPPNAIVLSESPIAFYVDDFLTPEECDHLVDVGRPIMKRALVSGDAQGEVSNVRTNSVGWVAAAGDPVLEQVEDRICGMFGARAECTENFQVIHYQENQEYKAHLDAYDMSTVRGQRTTAKGGQRLITSLIYLSDVIEGGGTGFVNLGVECPAKKGRVLFFYNCESNCLKPDSRTLHCGLPVLSGEKWAANKWIRQTPMRAPRPVKQTSAIDA